MGLWEYGSSSRPLPPPDGDEKDQDMRSLWRTTGDPLLDKITAKPFALLDSKDAPEVTKACFFPDTSSHAAIYHEQELGINPCKRTYASLHKTIPDAYILEAENVILFRGTLHSKGGEALADSFRIIDPHKGVMAGYSGHMHGLRPLNGHYFIHAPAAEAPPQFIHEETVIPFFSAPEFGHWILETLTSLWAQEHGAQGKYMLYPGTRLPAFMEILTAPFGLSKEDFFSPAEYMLLKRVLLPSKAYMHCGGYVSDRAKDVWKRVVDFHAPDEIKDPPRKLYVSRKNIPVRRLLNEARCEEIFSSYGFHIIQPEKLPLLEQIHLFSQATHVAGPIGSGMHNIIWARRPERVKALFLCSDSFLRNHNFFYIEQSFNRVSFTVYGSSASPPHDNSLYSEDWFLSETNLKMAIEQWLDA